jgi:hypothetical protein
MRLTRYKLLIKKCTQVPDSQHMSPYSWGFGVDVGAPDIRPGVSL